MVALLTLAVVAVVIIVVTVQQNNQIKERQQLSVASKTMSVDELLSQNDLLEREWDEWNEKWAKKVAWKRDSTTESNKRENAALKIKQIRATIKERFPDVITDSNGLKIKAHSVATTEEKNKMKTMESKLDSSYKTLRASGITGGQLLENTRSSVLRGAAATTLAGPLAGGLTYASTEAKNKEIQKSNMEKRAQNAVYDRMTNEIKGNQDQLNALYTEIIRKHDKETKIHLYKMQYY